VQTAQVQNVPQDARVPWQDCGLAGEVPCGQLRSTAFAGPGGLGSLLKGEAQTNMSSSATLSEKEIRIPIAGDHLVVREGLVAVVALQKHLQAVGQALDGEEACLLHDKLYPDLLLLDLRMP
jgi:hypothetical protein